MNNELMNTKIETVVFDVGWVLVELDFEPLLSYLRQGNCRYNIKEVIAAIDLEAHERGEMSSAMLVDRLHELAPELDRMLVKRGWLDMFKPVMSMFDLARDLGQRYRVHLLSNVGDLHWAHLNAQHNLRALVHDALPSFQAGVMKPHADIYRLAEERFGLQPASTVFIDDLLPNVMAARQRGWHAIQHASPQETIQALRDLGVEC
ncbi:MAG: HAD family phosphatase [Steroidobacteraceae bacterium]